MMPTAHPRRREVTASVAILVALGPGMAFGSYPQLSAGFCLPALFLCRSFAIRSMVAVLIAGQLVQFPWVATSLGAGLAWWAGSRWEFRGSGGCALTSQVSRTSGGLTMAVGIGAASGIVAASVVMWQKELRPVVFAFERPPWGYAVLLVIVGALANSIGEELIWRAALDSQIAWMTTEWQYLVQSTSFGLAHWGGVPGGFWGVVATAGFGVAALWLKRTYSTSTAVTAHFIADVAVFLAVIATADYFYVSVDRG